MRIYTKTGDQGTTGLIGGARVSKDDPRMRAVGAVDELNAVLGWVRVAVSDEPEMGLLESVQSELFDLGAELATPTDSPYLQLVIQAEHAARLEASIDRLTAELEPLRNFILPGGTELAARLHLARTVARRAERELVTFAEVEPIRAELLAYLNRLSDWLFVLARWANACAGQADVLWKRS